MDKFMYIFAIVLAYFLGNISPSTLIGRAMGIDIKKEGSGNAGTTNALRVLGKKAAIITLVVDIGKGVVFDARYARRDADRLERGTVAQRAFADEFHARRNCEGRERLAVREGVLLDGNDTFRQRDGRDGRPAERAFADAAHARGDVNRRKGATGIECISLNGSQRRGKRDFFQRRTHIEQAIRKRLYALGNAGALKA